MLKMNNTLEVCAFHPRLISDICYCLMFGVTAHWADVWCSSSYHCPGWAFFGGIASRSTAGEQWQADGAMKTLLHLSVYATRSTLLAWMKIIYIKEQRRWPAFSHSDVKARSWSHTGTCHKHGGASWFLPEWVLLPCFLLFLWIWQPAPCLGWTAGQHRWLLSSWFHTLPQQ